MKLTDNPHATGTAYRAALAACVRAAALVEFTRKAAGRTSK